MTWSGPRSKLSSPWWRLTWSDLTCQTRSGRRGQSTRTQTGLQNTTRLSTCEFLQIKLRHICTYWHLYLIAASLGMRSRWALTSCTLLSRTTALSPTIDWLECQSCSWKTSRIRYGFSTTASIVVYWIDVLLLLNDNKNDCIIYSVAQKHDVDVALLLMFFFFS